ncbi:uncharacterized protein BJ212DRAFT_1298115 [Suillus subaureus]|uniref:Uncharacterized protein n=1 Tax=Suillus subaureus TaxID=48587 RepID=A0A9P7JFT3_9AGAM|nr:uncharacterized protein BJ212DRAFT_1298115 [Suillus subaureus]KAG1819671.1 hypothetical protein BJ212DRAFT_1298115 [Suillus subaureus]
MTRRLLPSTDEAFGDETYRRPHNADTMIRNVLCFGLSLALRVMVIASMCQHFRAVVRLEHGILAYYQEISLLGVGSTSGRRDQRQPTWTDTFDGNEDGGNAKRPKRRPQSQAPITLQHYSIIRPSLYEQLQGHRHLLFNDASITALSKHDIQADIYNTPSSFYIPGVRSKYKTGWGLREP